MGPLAHGAVFIPYRVENLRILPVLGAPQRISAGRPSACSRRRAWHWGDFGDSNTIVVVGLPPGQHKVFIEQNVRLALSMAGRGYILESGRLAIEGEAPTLINSPEVRRIFLGG